MLAADLTAEDAAAAFTTTNLAHEYRMIAPKMMPDPEEASNMKRIKYLRNSAVSSTSKNMQFNYRRRSNSNREGTNASPAKLKESDFEKSRSALLKNYEIANDENKTVKMKNGGDYYADRFTNITVPKSAYEVITTNFEAKGVDDEI